jgi:sulfatase maturation enzyme AslB (radical SAM superfamily)
MCNPTDSVKIERELEANPDLNQYFPTKSTNPNISDSNWQELLEISKGLDSLYLTGGEPMIMKRYHDLLDHLIENDRHHDIILRIFTNCSVFNPIFIEKLVKFKRLQIKMSIDAVGKVAEYQRYGTDWKTVYANIFKFAELPIQLGIHSAITAYTVLDMSALADLFLEIKDYKNRKAELMVFNARVVRVPVALDCASLNPTLRVRAVREIDKAIEKLSPHRLFNNYVNELNATKNQLIKRKECNFESFVSMTKALDRARNESFEEVFGYKI